MHTRKRTRHSDVSQRKVKEWGMNEKVRESKANKENQRKERKQVIKIMVLKVIYSLSSNDNF